jgi:adenosyl cobinamide kinase/adenosyl cobinamide phosphate guanylyltransferase
MATSLRRADTSSTTEQPTEKKIVSVPRESGDDILREVRETNQRFRDVLGRISSSSLKRRAR